MSEDHTPPMSIESQDGSDDAHEEQDWPGYDRNQTDVEDLEDPVRFIDEDGRERTEEWRPYTTYLITEFFEDVARKFEQLEL
ncbi:hypothetical protein E8E11_003590 [Didymella keratinophila]|nr:hypothetical protein E8E11_003590 [Didymella keratinophila]